MENKEEEKSIGKTSSVNSADLVLLTKGCPVREGHYYQKKILLHCPFCKTCGTKKTFKSLWQLRYHFSYHHSLDADCKKIINDLENLLKHEVLA